MAFVDQFPFPFDKPMGQELLRTLTAMYRTEREAFAIVEQHGIDVLAVTPGLSPLNLWHDLLQKAAIAGVTSRIVRAAREAHPNNPRAAFLDALLADRSAPASAEPLGLNGPTFVSGDDSVTDREALLFFDDLPIATGRVSALISTLQRMLDLAPSVCLLRVSNAAGDFFGTGFRIGPDLVLTNEHVLVPTSTPAVKVHVEFGFETDAAGASLSSVALVGDVDSIRGDRADDWAVVRVAGMAPTWPTLDLAAAPPPRVGDASYILQHPVGRQKRLGFVRNTVTAVTERVLHYLTDTEPGSSGAPVFDAAGGLIGLHHLGGRALQVAGKPPVSKNEGIRISRVLAGLKAQGLVS